MPISIKLKTKQREINSDVLMIKCVNDQFKFIVRILLSLFYLKDTPKTDTSDVQPIQKLNMETTFLSTSKLKSNKRKSTELL